MRRTNRKSWLLLAILAYLASGTCFFRLCHSALDERETPIDFLRVVFSIAMFVHLGCLPNESRMAPRQAFQHQAARNRWSRKAVLSTSFPILQTCPQSSRWTSGGCRQVSIQYFIAGGRLYEQQRNHQQGRLPSSTPAGHDENTNYFSARWEEPWQVDYSGLYHPKSRKWKKLQVDHPECQHARAR